MWGHSEFEDEILIQIYINGIDSVQYRIDDLVADKSMLQTTISHTLWYDDVFVKNDTLFVLTLENKVVRIDMNTGKIVNKQNISECQLCQQSEDMLEPETKIYYDIKYPKAYVFPDLVHGASFRESLITSLEKIEVKEYKDADHFITVFGTIDRNGVCEIFYIDTSIKEEKNEIWDNKVRAWITNQKYQTDLIPINCDKWVFKEFFYLK